MTLMIWKLNNPSIRPSVAPLLRKEYKNEALILNTRFLCAQFPTFSRLPLKIRPLFANVMEGYTSWTKIEKWEAFCGIFGAAESGGSFWKQGIKESR